MVVNQLSGVSAVYGNLSDKDKEIVGTLEELFKINIDKVQRFCDFIAKKMNGKNLMDFTVLSPEGKLQACLDYVVIGLVSGTITDMEIQNLIKE